MKFLERVPERILKERPPTLIETKVGYMVSSEVRRKFRLFESTKYLAYDSTRNCSYFTYIPKHILAKQLFPSTEEMEDGYISSKEVKTRRLAPPGHEDGFDSEEALSREIFVYPKKREYPHILYITLDDSGSVEIFPKIPESSLESSPILPYEKDWGYRLSKNIITHYPALLDMIYLEYRDDGKILKYASVPPHVIEKRPPTEIECMVGVMICDKLRSTGIEHRLREDYFSTEIFANAIEILKMEKVTGSLRTISLASAGVKS